MTVLRSMCLAGAILVISGCAWQKLPPTPVYTLEAPIPIRVGILLADPSVGSFELAVLDEWKKMQLFISMVYPYKDGDPVDAVVRLTVRGGWDQSVTANDFVNSALVGASFGLLASVLPNQIWTGTHEAIAIVNKIGNDEIGRYTVQATSKVENAAYWTSGNPEKNAENAGKVQVTTIANELATKIRTDRQGLVQRFKK